MGWNHQPGWGLFKPSNLWIEIHGRFLYCPSLRSWLLGGGGSGGWGQEQYSTFGRDLDGKRWRNKHGYPPKKKRLKPYEVEVVTKCVQNLIGAEMLVRIGCRECVLSSNVCLMLNAFVVLSISKVIAFARNTIDFCFDFRGWEWLGSFPAEVHHIEIVTLQTQDRSQQIHPNSRIRFVLFIIWCC